MPDEAHHVPLLERLLCLKTFPLFAALLPEQLTSLAEASRERFFRRRDPVIPTGGPVRAVHFVVEGAVRSTSRDGHGQERTTVLGPGHGVGLLEMLARRDEGIGAISAGDTVTLALDRDALLDVLEDEVAIFRHLLRAMVAPLIEEVTTGRLVPPEPGASPPPTPSRDLDLAERILFMRDAFPFARSSIITLAELARAAEVAWLEPGEVLWSAGDRADDAALVVGGTLTCEAPGGVVFHAAREHPAGLLEALVGGPRWYTATAPTRAMVLRVGANGLLDAVEEDFDVAMELLGLLAGRLLGSEAWERASTVPPAVTPRAS